MTKKQPDAKLVYLALKNTFKGKEAQVRQAKKVRELILRSQHNDDVKKLIEEHDLDNVCNSAKTLLEQQIFESTSKAKKRFPEVFEVSAAQSAERSASEAKAAKTEADAIRVAGEGQKSNRPLDTSQAEATRTEPNAIRVTGEGEKSSRPLKLSQDVLVPHDKEQPAPLGDSAAGSCNHSFHHATVNVPSLYPVYLPYQTQHQLLVKVQGILEKACYDFGIRILKETVECEGWDCAEAVELHRWPRVFLYHQDKFQQADLGRLGKSFAQTLDSITHLRHTAVHRVRISANRLEEFVIDAEALARLLRDEYSLQKLSRLRTETQITIGELKRNKDLLESKINSKFQNIATQRAQLDRLEQMAIKEMLQEDKEYQALAGAHLDQVINSRDTVEAPTETEAGSKADLKPDLEPDVRPDLGPDLGANLDADLYADSDGGSQACDFKQPGGLIEGETLDRR